MKIAIVCSNYLSIKKDTHKGTEIIAYDFINCLARRSKENELHITAFASGDSDLPVKIESVGYHSSSMDEHIIKAGKHIIFELALLSKAFSKQDEFDIFHINIGDGDIALPFASFIKKPILVTLYHPTDIHYAKKYFSLFKRNKNVFFVSPTNIQRRRLPFFNYISTIHHGVDTNTFKFNAEGGSDIMWAGRAIPSKGMDLAMEVARQVEQKIKLFAIRKKEYDTWLDSLLKQIKSATGLISIELDRERAGLIEPFGQSKLFLFPISWEEPFGLVLIESMSCGTPVIAYARGSVPEIIKDGKTGFLVNPSETNIRGNWIIKNTGIDGLCEAVEKIYSMPEKEYQKMRQNCRGLVEKSFSANRMVEEYLKVYKKLVSPKH